TPIRYVKGFENITQISNVEAELRRRNYSEENLANIMGGNWMRVYRAAWS
ncbi:MAG: membrane dipeptidase, partial [Candidatus Eremiobacteraeota bacterium]|nr:membrane dipeptidase [Candidatus Eremiobacteraeota bacterium]